MGQLTERSLVTLEEPGSNQADSNFFKEKTKVKKIAHLLVLATPSCEDKMSFYRIGADQTLLD